MIKPSKKIKPLKKTIEPNIMNNILIPLFLVKIIAEQAYKAGYEGDLDSKELDCINIIQQVLEQSSSNSTGIFASQNYEEGLKKQSNKEIKKLLEEILPNQQLH